MTAQANKLVAPRIVYGWGKLRVGEAFVVPFFDRSRILAQKNATRAFWRWKARHANGKARRIRTRCTHNGLRIERIA